MSSEQELKNISSSQKEFQSLLEQDFNDRKLKESTFQAATEGAPERNEANDFIEARL